MQEREREADVVMLWLSLAKSVFFFPEPLFFCPSALCSADDRCWLSFFSFVLSLSRSRHTGLSRDGRRLLEPVALDVPGQGVQDRDGKEEEGKEERRSRRRRRPSIACLFFLSLSLPCSLGFLYFLFLPLSVSRSTS